MALSFERIARETMFSVAGSIHSTTNASDVTNLSIASSVVLGTVYQLQDSGAGIVYTDLWNLVVKYNHASGGWVTATLGTDYVCDLFAGTVTFLGGAVTAGDAVEASSFSLYLPITFTSETPANDIEAVSTSLTPDEINNNKILVFVFKAGHESQYEIFSLKAVTAIGGGVYSLTVRRQRYGSTFGGDGSYVFTTGDTVFITARAGLVGFVHESFPTMYAEAAQATFRLTPSTAWVAADMADVYDATNNPTGLTTETVYTFGDPFAPHAAWVQLANTGPHSITSELLTTNNVPGVAMPLANRNVDALVVYFRQSGGNPWLTATLGTDYICDLVAGTVSSLLGGNIGIGWQVQVDYHAYTSDFADLSSFVTPFPPGTSFRFSVQLTDANGDLASIVVQLVLGGAISVLMQEALPASASQTRTVQFTLRDVGSYSLYAVVTDATGRVTKQPLTLVGSGTPATIAIQEVSPLQVIAPDLSPAGHTGHFSTVTVTCATAGATIHYAITTGGVPGSWTTLSGSTVTVGPNKMLWAYATAGGLVASVVSSLFCDDPLGP